MNGSPDDDPLETRSDARKRRVSMADGALKEPVELPVFLGSIGELMQLPSKGSGKHETEQAAARPRGRGSNGRQATLLIALGVLVGGVLLARALRPASAHTLPTALAGVWRTDAPRYADRRLEITPTSLGFHAGEGGTAGPRYPIARVRRSEETDGTLFRVEYLEGGDRIELDFVWRDSPRPEIRFANQKDLVWTRGAPADSGAVAGRSAR